VRSIVSQTYRDWKLVVVAKGNGTDRIAATVKDAITGRHGNLVRNGRRAVSRASNATVAVVYGDGIAIAPWTRGRRASSLTQATVCLAR
jgi:glycosyltransferase involved in cell wall biosynthesis